MKQEENIDEGALIVVLLIMLLGIFSMIPWIIMAIFISKYCLLGCLTGIAFGYWLVKRAKIRNDYED